MESLFYPNQFLNISFQTILIKDMKSTMGFRLFFVTLMASTTAAADDAEFAFNLFSDIAP